MLTWNSRMTSTLATPMTSIGSVKSTRSSSVIGRNARTGHGMWKRRSARGFSGISTVAVNPHLKATRWAQGCAHRAMPSVTGDLVEGVDVGANVRRRADDRHLREDLGLIVEELVSVVGFALALQRLERTL